MSRSFSELLSLYVVSKSIASGISSARASPAFLGADLPMDQSARTAVIKRGLVWIGVSIFLLVLFSLTALHTVPRSADNATALLEGDAITHGNLLLHHWLLSLDSFWTIDALFYALGVAVVGLNYNLLFIVNALIATCVVVAAVGCVRSVGRGRGWMYGVFTVGLLLVLPSPDFAYYLLQGPWHVGTTLWALLAFWLVTRRTFGLAWGVAVVLLSFALLGDLVAVAIGVVPCLLVGVLWALRDRAWRHALSAISCGVAALALAFALRAIASAVGTFDYAYRNVPLSWTTAWRNVASLWNRLMGFLGIENISLPGITNGNNIERATHLLGALAVLIGLAFAIRRSLLPNRSRARDDVIEQRTIRLNDMLLVGTAGSVLLYVAGSPSDRLTDTTFLTPAIVFAAILSGMAVAEIAQRISDRQGSQIRPGATVAGWVFAVLALGAYVSTFAITFHRPSTTEQTRQLGSFLVAHHLTSGLGDYPTAALVVAATGGASKVRPLIPGRSGRLVADNRQVSTRWYEGVQFNFFVYNFKSPWRDVTSGRAVHTFGAYSQMYTVGPFHVLVWQHTLSVAPPVPGKGSPLNIK